MVKILVNDGIEEDGKLLLEDAGFTVDTKKIPQEDLMRRLPAYDAIIVRSATQVRKDLIDACPNLKIIARGGVGLDNIDVAYAKSKGIEIINNACGIFSVGCGIGDGAYDVFGAFPPQWQPRYGFRRF
jgi:D-3-phosphoglycerate dehydrogenase / 2-oxoglutarate reductase